MTASDHLSQQFGQLKVIHEPDGMERGHERVTGYFDKDDDDHGVAGYISHRPDPSGTKTTVRTLHVDEDRRRMGVASGLMRALETKYGPENIDHGERTPDGAKWWENRK